MWTDNELWFEHVRGQSVVKNRTRDWMFIWWLLLVGLFGLLFWRVAFIQLGQGNDLFARAESQRIRTLVLPSARGKILDRNGYDLVSNVPIFQKVMFDPSRGLTYEKISRDEYNQLLVSNSSYPVMEIVDRDYLIGEDGAHILGYVGAISSKELQENLRVCPGKQFFNDSLIGRSGIEDYYDCELRGKDGELIVEVDTAGRLVRIMGRKDPVAGENLQLTVDKELQLYSAELMKDYKGAVIAMSPITGEIIAMGSYPSFDPNWFSLRQRNDDIERYSAQIGALFNDPDRSMLNRAISSAYPPGSIFKLISSLAGLESEKISESDYYEDTGVVTLGSYEFRNWYYLKYGAGEGQVNVVRALSRSTDTYYYDLGGKIGPDVIAEWARKFVMGSSTGIDLKGEAKGLIPDPEWKLQTKKERWYLGNTYHMAIGQGDVLATPLQLATITGPFVNGGFWCKPYLNQNNQSECHRIDSDDRNLEVVLEGMIGACSPGGTAGVFYNQPYQVACKTGTAEYGPRNELGRRATHAWFTMVGPMEKISNNWVLSKDNPIVVTVLVESGGEGSEKAAPVAKRIMDRWMGID